MGPTAVGKTAVTRTVAAALGAEIVVADPFQRYVGLEIAADTPAPDDRGGVPHHLIGDLALSDAGSVAEYAQRAHTIIDRIVDGDGTVVVSGGSGLYVRAALADMEFPPDPPDVVRADVERLVRDDLGSAVSELRERAPATAARVDIANPRRVARALALARVGRELPLSAGLWSGDTRRPTIIIGLTRPRDVLHELIARRVDREMADGLVDELRAASARPDLSRTAAQIIGMREVTALVRGEITHGELRERLVVRTRRLARSQETWIRKTPGIVPVGLGTDPPERHVETVLGLLRRPGPST